MASGPGSLAHSRESGRSRPKAGSSLRIRPMDDREPATASDNAPTRPLPPTPGVLSHHTLHPKASHHHGPRMPRVEYLIMAAGALAAGLALGPIINRRSRQSMILGGILAALIGGALLWPPSRVILSRTLAFDLFGLSSLGLEFLTSVLFGIAAVLLALAFGAAVTGT